MSHADAATLYDCGACHADTRRIRRCPLEGHDDTYCAIGDYHGVVAIAVKAYSLLERQLVGLDDLDGWALEAGEAVGADLARARREQPKDRVKG